MSDELADALDSQSAETDALRKKIASLERSLLAKGDVEARLETTEAELEKVEREFELLAGFSERTEPPGWLKTPKASKGHRGTPWLMLSDLHLDEVVVPEQVLGVNKYDRDIALGRLQRTAHGFITVYRDYLSNVQYDGAVVVLGGDIFSGSIHEELRETNADTLLGSVDFWIDPLADLIQMVHEEFGLVHIPVVPGNHGRTTRKPRHKFRARDNFDWFVGAQLARLFKGNDMVTFDCSESADCIVPSYGQSVMVTHGDQASGGSGWGGIFSPISRMDDKKSKRQAAVKMPYDLMVLGHWHQLIYGPNWIVNGAMKGYDEYAFDNNFGYELPQQASWMMTPEHGRTWTVPIFSQDREAEGW